VAGDVERSKLPSHESAVRGYLLTDEADEAVR